MKSPLQALREKRENHTRRDTDDRLYSAVDQALSAVERPSLDARLAAQYGIGPQR